MHIKGYAAPETKAAIERPHQAMGYQARGYGRVLICQFKKLRSKLTDHVAVESHEIRYPDAQKN